LRGEGEEGGLEPGGEQGRGKSKDCGPRRGYHLQRGKPDILRRGVVAGLKARERNL